ncbi:MAG: tetratricopeptide repeat protein [Trichodesmium sp.]
MIIEIICLINEKIEKVAINFHQIAEVSLAQVKLDEAYIACLKPLNNQPEFAAVCKTLGDIFQAKGNIEAATTYYNKAIEILPYFAEAHANLGSMYAKQQHWEESIFYYQKAIYIKPNLAGVYRNLRE